MYSTPLSLAVRLQGSFTSTNEVWNGGAVDGSVCSFAELLDGLPEDLKQELCNEPNTYLMCYDVATEVHKR